MPLLKIEKAPVSTEELTEEIQQQLTNKLRQMGSSKEPAIVLFTDIAQDLRIYLDLCRELQLTNPNRDIFAWCHSLNMPERTKNCEENDDTKRHAYKQNPNLMEEGELKAECIISKIPGVYPILVGFSKGCNDAIWTALALKKIGLDFKLILIDGVSPDCAKSYFSNEKHNAALTLDLIAMVKYAARLSVSEENSAKIDNLKFSTNFKFTLQEKNAADSIDAITDFVLTSFSEILEIEKFKNYIYLIKQAIHNMKNAPDLNEELMKINPNFIAPNNLQEKTYNLKETHTSNLSHESQNADLLDNSNLPNEKIVSTTNVTNEKKLDFKFNEIITLITESTATKYNTFCGGWAKYTKQLIIIDDPDLTNLSHHEVIKTQKNQRIPGKLATRIEKCARDVTEDEKFQAVIKNLMREYSNKQGQAYVISVEKVQPNLLDKNYISSPSTPEYSAPITIEQKPHTIRSSESPTNVQSYSDNDSSTDETNDSNSPPKFFGESSKKFTFYQPPMRTFPVKPYAITVDGPSPK